MIKEELKNKWSLNIRKNKHDKIGKKKKNYKKTEESFKGTRNKLDQIDQCKIIVKLKQTSLHLKREKNFKEGETKHDKEETAKR